MDNQPYQLKLSGLRVFVSKELIQVSGELKEATTLVKAFIEEPSSHQSSEIRKSLLATAERLELLESNLAVLNKRIEIISTNFKGTSVENKAVEALKNDVPLNTRAVEQLKSHYLDLVKLFRKSDKKAELKNDNLTDFDCFKDILIIGETDINMHKDILPKKETVIKKRKWFFA